MNPLTLNAFFLGTIIQHVILFLMLINILFIYLFFSVCCFPKAGGPDSDNSNTVLREMVFCISPASSYENLSFVAEEKTATEIQT